MYCWEDRASSMFWERMEKKKDPERRTGRWRERTVITGRATDTVSKGILGNFVSVVGESILSLLEELWLMTHFLKMKHFAQSGFGGLERKEQLYMAGVSGWLDQLLLFPTPTKPFKREPDTGRCKGRENHIQRNGKKKIYNQGFGCSLYSMSWDYEFSSFALNENSM